MKHRDRRPCAALLVPFARNARGAGERHTGNAAGVAYDGRYDEALREYDEMEALREYDEAEALREYDEMEALRESDEVETRNAAWTAARSADVTGGSHGYCREGQPEPMRWRKDR